MDRDQIALIHSDIEYDTTHPGDWIVMPHSPQSNRWHVAELRRGHITGGTGEASAWILGRAIYEHWTARWGTGQFVSRNATTGLATNFTWGNTFGWNKASTAAIGKTFVITPPEFTKKVFILGTAWDSGGLATVTSAGGTVVVASLNFSDAAQGDLAPSFGTVRYHPSTYNWLKVATFGGTGANGTTDTVTITTTSAGTAVINAALAWIGAAATPDATNAVFDPDTQMPIMYPAQDAPSAISINIAGSGATLFGTLTGHTDVNKTVVDEVNKFTYQVGVTLTTYAPATGWTRTVAASGVDSFQYRMSGNMFYRYRAQTITGMTWAEAGKTLTKEGAFATYQGEGWYAGDRIYLSGGTGVTAGWKEIASVDVSGDFITLLDAGVATDTEDDIASTGWGSEMAAFEQVNVFTSSGVGIRQRWEWTAAAAARDLRTGGGYYNQWGLDGDFTRGRAVPAAVADTALVPAAEGNPCGATGSVWVLEAPGDRIATFVAWADYLIAASGISRTATGGLINERAEGFFKIYHSQGSEIDIASGDVLTTGHFRGVTGQESMRTLPRRR